MHTERALRVVVPNQYAALLDWTQMLTGAILILFMWGHMLMVASVNLGVDAFDWIAKLLEAFLLTQVFGPVIGLLFLIHFAVALRKIPVRSFEQISIWRQATMLRHKDTWLWLVQAGSAMLILIMGSAHMWVVLGDLPITAAKSAARVGGLWLPFYLLLLPLAELHVGIGLYRIGVKWGFISRRNRTFCHRTEVIVTAGFILIGLTTLVQFCILNLQHL
ncbi:MULTISPECIES: succinate dehydrogenase/fumarate reductase cytochrome b subunit [unclassified Pseudodesulfovibrio]|uniref:succinate dehydrogenase/fumarate reductase cytochrome b subunit n=1 Tax=unclassified Pseudodesulfovibrio TaxID=2661612 RepID=UPI000FEB94B3|nr:MULTISPECIES: succinate dehydrogenase/fumarate reductase cytochrome b subunit [unclassified Pseudodesulfovibrio]MCJ2163426.1 succinate dehydrogenase/fumarate reductase cytochrome b subunit [Pseudodesulfovibrio sp. S3-i]RWU06663.1 succinate dehydrogenase/fumarate reductase cytochrome b subunit [Pseudodesulfovibrio sp. S3]